MKFANRAKIVPNGDGYRVESNFEVRGERLVVGGATLREAKNNFREEASKAGISDRGYSFSIGVRAPTQQTKDTKND